MCNQIRSTASALRPILTSPTLCGVHLPQLDTYGEVSVEFCLRSIAKPPARASAATTKVTEAVKENAPESEKKLDSLDGNSVLGHHPADDEEMWQNHVQYLSAGATLLKHGRQGDPKARNVSLPELS